MEGRERGGEGGRKGRRKEEIGMHISVEGRPGGYRKKEDDSPLPVKERDPRSPVDSLACTCSLKN